MLKSPEEEKFRTLNMENAAIQTKITKLSGGIKIMKGLGFVVKQDVNKFYLAQENIDQDLLFKSQTFFESKVH